MARKVFSANSNAEQICTDLVSNYITKKQQYDALKKEVDELNKLVKLFMADNNLGNVVRGQYKVTKSDSQRITWQHDLLLDKVKTYNMPELIEQVEQVNMPALEQAILDETVNVEDLMDCQQTTDVVTLRISKVKEDKNEL
jgi:hypothetical protein